MRISPIYKYNNSFLNTANNLNKRKQVSEKAAYIDAKTKPLEELALLSFIGAFLSGMYNNAPKPNKLSIGFVIASILLLALKWIKQVKLSRDYDKEDNFDSKSNASA